MSRPVIVQLTPQECAYARQVAQGRHTTGGPSRPLVGGHDAMHADLVGAMAEIAVCKHYGEDYATWVRVEAKRPGAVPDLRYRGYAVSVKGTHHWRNPHLVVNGYDTHNDVYILVSVDIGSRQCGLQGWLPRGDLLRYPAQPWLWLDRSDKARPTEVVQGVERVMERTWRYVPCAELRECKGATWAQSIVR